MHKGTYRKPQNNNGGIYKHEFKVYKRKVDIKDTERKQIKTCTIEFVVILLLLVIVYLLG